MARPSVHAQIFSCVFSISCVMVIVLCWHVAAVAQQTKHCLQHLAADIGESEGRESYTFNQTLFWPSSMLSHKDFMFEGRLNLKSLRSYKQWEPDVCCHASLCCSAGTAGGVCHQRGACSSGGRDRNWKDLHCSAPGQSHRYVSEPCCAAAGRVLGSIFVLW